MRHERRPLDAGLARYSQAESSVRVHDPEPIRGIKFIRGSSARAADDERLSRESIYPRHSMIGLIHGSRMIAKSTCRQLVASRHSHDPLYPRSTNSGSNHHVHFAWAACHAAWPVLDRRQEIRSVKKRYVPKQVRINGLERRYPGSVSLRQMYAKPITQGNPMEVGHGR